MKKRFFVLTVLCALTCLSWGQSTIKERLEAKYGWAVEHTTDGKKWYSVIKDGKEGACDANGNEIVPPIFNDVSVRYKDKYVKAVKDKQTSIYDLQGKLILATPYEDVLWYQMEQYGYCEVKRAGLRGVINRKGDLVVPCEFNDVSIYNKEKYAKAVKDKQTSIYDLQGKLILATPYEDVLWYQTEKDGYCEVKRAGLRGLINRNGDLVVPCEFDEISTYYLKEEGFCTVEQNKKQGVYDIRARKLIIPCEYDYIDNFQLRKKDRTEVRKGKGVYEKNGVYDIRKNQEVIPCLYDMIDMYNDKQGLYTVVREGHYGVSNDQGTEVVPCKYSSIIPFGETKYFIGAKGGNRPADHAPARLSYLSRPMGSLCGVLDVTGREVVPFEYDVISYIKDDVAECCEGVTLNLKTEKTIYDTHDNNKAYKVYSIDYNFEKAMKGYYNMKTGKCTPCQYKDGLIGEGYIACLNLLGKWGYLDAESMEVAIPFEYESAKAFENGVAQVKKDGKVAFITDPRKGTTLKLANGGTSIKVDVNIPTSENKREESFAFIIANENYAHLKGADYAINDGKVFKEYCLKTFGMPESNVRYYEDATYGNMANAVKKIRDIADVYDGDANIIIYFSGLGATDAQKERYLLPTDATLATLNVTGYSLQQLMDELNSLNTKQTIVIIDAPFSGLDKEGKMLGENRGVAIAPKPAVPQGNTILISGCSDSESAYSLKDYGHSLFTYGLLEKIQESKGQCSLKEAVDYATTWVKKESLKRFNKTQSPSMQSSETITEKVQTIKF